MRTPSIIASVKRKVDLGVIVFDANNNPTVKTGGKPRLRFLPAIKLPRKYYYVAFAALIIILASYEVGSRYPAGLVRGPQPTAFQTGWETGRPTLTTWGPQVVVSPVVNEPTRTEYGTVTQAGWVTVWEYYPTASPAVPTAVYIPPSAQPGQKLVKMGELTIEVKDIENSLSEVRKIAASLGGYIADSNVELIPDYYQRRQGWIVVRIPTDQFETALDDFQAIGKVTKFRVTTSDVGETYIDYQARLENLKREEQRLLEFFSKAQNISEVMIVEGQLVRVREQIEQLTAQIKNLENKIAYGSITLNLYEPSIEEKRPSAPQPSWTESMLTAAMNGLASSTWAVLVGFAAILPYLVVLLGIYALGRWTWPRIRSSVYSGESDASKGSEPNEDE